MTAKKAPADTADEEITAPADVEDAVVDEIPGESTEDLVIAADGIGAPAPITPSSTASEHEDRVSYENQVNADATDFAAEAFATYIDTTINGGTVEIVSTYPED